MLGRILGISHQNWSSLWADNRRCVKYRWSWGRRRPTETEEASEQAPWTLSLTKLKKSEHSLTKWSHWNRLIELWRISELMWKPSRTMSMPIQRRNTLLHALSSTQPTEMSASWSAALRSNQNILWDRNWTISVPWSVDIYQRQTILGYSHHTIYNAGFQDCAAPKDPPAYLWRESNELVHILVPVQGSCKQ